MTVPGAGEVTRLLEDVRRGEASAMDELFRVVYEELRRVAESRMQREPVGHTLQPTALVHEAWLRLVGKTGDLDFSGRAHFFGAATLAMRRILVERARRVRRIRHGGEMERASTSELVQAADSEDPVELLALDRALTKLEGLDEVKATVASMRFLFGCSVEETAEALRISPSKVKKDWAFARAWLQRELAEEVGDG